MVQPNIHLPQEISPPQQNFIATAKTSDTGKVKQRIIIKTSINLSATAEKLESAVKAIIVSLQDQHLKSKTFAVTITAIEDNAVTYAVGNQKETQTISLNLPGDPTLTIDLKSMKNVRTKPSLIGFQGHLQKLLNLWPAKVPVIKLGWNHIIAPLVALHRTSVEKSARQDIAEKDIKLMKQFSSKGPKSLLAALEEGIKMQKGIKISGEKNLKQQMNDCLAIGKDVNAFLEKGKPLEKVAKEAARTLLRRFNRPVFVPGQQLLTIPAGYWKEGAYYPCILTFYRNNQNQLCMEKLSSDPSAKENTTTAKLTYVFEAKETLENDLAQMLETLWLYQKSGKDKLSGDELKRIKVLEHYFKIGGGLGSMAPQDAKQPNATDLFDGIIISAGGVLHAEGEKKTTTPKRDPWNLISHWMRSEFPQAKLADKLTLTLDVVNHHIETILERLEKLNKEEKQRLLPIIKEQISKMKRTVNKEFGSEQAFDILSAEHSAFRALEEKVRQIEESMQSIDERQAQKTARSLGKDFSSAATTKLNATLIAPQMSVKDVKPPTLDPNFVYKKLPELQAFRAAIEGNNSAQAKVLFEALSTALDEAVSKGDHRQAIALGAEIMAALPPPSLPSGPGIPVVGPPNIWDSLPKAELDAWSKTLSTITQSLWESQTRLGEGHLWPNQRIDLFNSRAILVKLARLKTETVKNTLIEKLTNSGKNGAEEMKTLLSEKKYTELGALCKQYDIPLQDAMELMFDGFTADRYQVRHAITLERFMPATDPAQDLKLLQIERFFETNQKYGGGGGIVVRMDSWKDMNKPQTHLGDLDYLQGLEALKNGYLGADFKATSNADYFKVIARSADGSPSMVLPSSLIDLRRHTMMVQTLMQPEYSLYLSFPPTPTGVLDAVAWFKNKMQKAQDLAKTSEDVPKKVRDLQQAEVIQRMRKIDRLELSVGEYVVNKEPQIKVVPKEANIDSEAIEGLVYRPSGLDLPQDIVKSFPDLRNNDNHQPAIGHVPLDLISTAITGSNKTQKEVHQQISNTLLNSDRISPFDYKTETGAMATALQNDNRSPIDHYLLSTLTVKELNDTPLSLSYSSPLEVLDLIIQRPDLLEDEQNQRVLEIALFKPHMLQRLLHTNPEFIAQRSLEIKGLIQRSIERGNLRTAGFLMHAGDRIKQHAKVTAQLSALPGAMSADPRFSPNPYIGMFYTDHHQDKNINLIPPDMASLDTIRNIFPDYDIEYNVGNKVQKGYEILASRVSESESSQKFLYTQLLDWFYNTYKGGGKSPLELPDPFLAKILYGYAILKNVGTDEGLPFLQKQAVQWMEFQVIPQLAENLGKPEYFNKMSDTLDAFCAISQTVIPGGNWIQSPEDGSIFQKGALSVNLKTGLIKSGEAGGELKGPKALLPIEVTSSPEYSTLFGEQRFEAHCIPGTTPQDFTYFFTLEGGRKFRIEYNRDLASTVISQWLEPDITLGNSAEWHQFQKIKSENPKNAERVLQNFGIWKSETQNKAFAILNKPADWKKSDVFRVKISSNSTIEELETLKEGPKNESLKVCQDVSGKYSHWLRFIGDGSLLFLRSPGMNSPSEIRILDKGIILKKQKDGSWLCTEGKYKGFKWLTDFSEQGQNGVKASSTARAFSNALGDALPECMLPIKDGKEEKFLVWPHQLTSDSITSPTGKKTLEFRKGLTLQDEQQKPLLEISVKSNGEIKSTCAGFLYLSYLFEAKGDIKRANYYMNRAVEQRLTTPAERQSFEDMVSAIRDLPQRTMRQLAYKLKAELAIAKIRRQQTQEPVYNPSEPEKYMLNIQRLTSLHNAYAKRLEEVTKSKPQAVIEEELELTPNDRTEYERIRLESMRFLLEAVPPQLDVQAPKALGFTVPARMNEAPKDFMLHLLAFMGKPTLKPSENIKQIGYLNQNNILKDFWSYVYQIKEEKLTPQDLAALFTATIQQKPNAAEEEKSIDKSVDFARRLLLSLAALNVTLKTNEGIYQDMLNVDQENAKQAYQVAFKPFVDVMNLFTKERIKGFYDQKTSLPSDFPKEGSMWLTKKIYTALLAKNLHNINMASTSMDAPLTSLLNILKQNPPQATTLSIKAAPQQLPAAGSPKPDLDPKTSLEKVKQDIEAGISPLSPEEQTVVKQVIERLEKEDPEAINTKRSMASLLMLIGEHSGVSMIEERRLNVMADRIAALESRMRLNVIKPGDYFKGYANVSLLDAQSQAFNSNKYFIDAQGVSAERIDFLAGTVASYFQGGKDPMEIEENSLLVKGSKIAADNIKLQSASLKTLPENQIEGLSKDIKTRRDDLSKLIATQRTELLDWAATQSAPPALIKMSKERDLTGDAAIIERVLDLYQRGQLKTGANENTDICNKVTMYLLNYTESQQLERAAGMISDLKEIAAKRSKAPQGSDEYARQDQEYGRMSAEIFKTIQAGSNQLRYLDAENNMQLKNPAFSRKFLVTEYRNGVILRKEQITIIDKIIEDPNRLAQLRMGLGKTSYILPIIMQLLSEMGMLPIAIVTDELFKMNRESMDQTTRDLFRQAAMVFDFDIDTPASPAFLAEKYHRLLKAKEDNGYIITTAGNLAALSNKLTSTSETLRKLEIKLMENPDDLAAKMQIFNLVKQRTWMVRIKALLDGDVDKYGFRTQFFADEGDEIFDDRREINNALEGSRKPDPNVTDVAHHLMHAIMEADNHSDASLIKIKTAIMENKQASLTKDELKLGMRALAKKAMQPPMKDQLGLSSLQNLNEENWIKFITGESKDPLIGMPQDPDLRKKISALKRSLSSTFSQVLEKSLNIDMGVRKKDGCVVAPRQNKEEKPNTQFGDEYELVLSHYLHYSAIGPNDKFLEASMRKLIETAPAIYQEIHNQAVLQTPPGQKVDILAYMKKPEAWKYRIALLENAVIDQGFIKLAKEQITTNVHDIIRGRQCGVASGTMNPASLPEGFNRDLCGDGAREVEAETYLKIAQSDPQNGLNQKARIIDDNQVLKAIQDILGDREVKSIITQGSAIEGKTTLEIIEALRAAPHGNTRQYIFVHPEKRIPYMWHPGKDRPEPFDQALVNPDICLFYFDPADTRGTDFKIPSGKNIPITGPTTLQSQYAQAAWRLRNLGPNQRVECWVLDSVANRIAAKQNVPKGEITMGHVINDIKQKTLEEQAPLNFKAAMLRIKGVSFTGMQRAIYPDELWKKDKNYWNTSDKQSMATLMTDFNTENFLFSISRNLYIQSKEIDFESDLNPTDQVQVMTKIQDAYNSEANRLKTILHQIEFMALTSEIIEEAEDVDKLKEMIQKDPMALIKIVQSLGGSPEMIQTMADIFSKDPERIKSFIATATLLEKRIIDPIHYSEKMAKARAEVILTMQQLEKSKRDFLSKAEEHQKYLPQTVASNVSANQNVLEQVQQQQQQQQQQQVQKKAGEISPDLKQKKYQTPNFTQLLAANVQLNDSHINTISDGFNAKNCGLEAEGIYMTAEMSDLYQMLPGVNGDPIARLAIIKSKDGGDYRVCLIGKNDYHNVFNKVGTKKEKSAAHEGNIMAVYSIDNTAQIGNAKSVGLNFVDSGNTKPDLNDKGLIRKCAIARFMMGFTNHTDNEKASLSEWIKGLSEVNYQNLLKMIRAKGTNQQVNMLKSLKT